MEIKLHLISDSANSYPSRATFTMDANGRYIYIDLVDPDRTVCLDVHELKRVIKALTDED